MVVFLGFFVAGYLINSSYSDWQASPVATSIETHAIEDLDFPTVTVCPPKGSNTALNYDLMKAHNNSLTIEDRENIKKEANYFFVITTIEHSKNTAAVVNKENLRKTFLGFQSVPEMFAENHGFEIRMWDNIGTWHTPGFREEYDQRYYEDDKYFNIILELPNNLPEQISSGSLIINLEVDIREEEGWQEDIVYWRGPKYKLYGSDIEFSKHKTWSDAEAHCQKRGGHLASVLTKAEQKEIETVAAGNNVWIGGTDLEQEGVWQWSDGTQWGFTNWQPPRWSTIYGNQGVSYNCASLRLGKTWIDESCTATTNPFVCQSMPDRALRGIRNISLVFSHDEATFSSFRVAYRLKHNQKLLDSWKDKKMTGFQVSWRIENPTLLVSTSEVGKVLQTPGLRGETFDNSFYTASRAYKGKLLVTQNVIDQVGNGSLLIQLESYTRVADGWLEEVKYLKTPMWGSDKYKLFSEKKTWADAKAHCQVEGGHLASVHTAEDNRKISLVAGSVATVWIGGSDQEEEGVWRWRDGSPIVNITWKDGTGSQGVKYNCIIKNGQVWMDYLCEEELPFICQSPDGVGIKGNSNLTFEFFKDQLSFSSFSVGYQYTFSKDLLNSCEDKKMTGFKLSWFVQNIYGSRLTEEKPETETDWKSITALPNYQDEYLVNTVQIASIAASEEKTKRKIELKALKEKAEILHSGSLHYSSMCNGGKILDISRPLIFEAAGFKLGSNSKSDIITEDDIQTGFMVFSSLMSCSEQLALSQFLHSILSTESPRTIIQATVNTIQSDNIKDKDSRKLLNLVFLALDKKLNFQLGKILLAISSKLELDSMIAKDWPYFTNYTEEIDQCLSGANCQGVRDLVQTLGK